MISKETFTRIFLQQQNKSTDDANIKHHMYKWWQSHRSKESGGLRLSDDGFDFLMEWASLGLPFAKTDYPKILNEFCIQLKQNPLAFFHTFFRELLESDFSKEQKESLIYFMTFSINSLFQLYFSLLTPPNL